MATLPFKSVHKEQQYMFGVKSLLMVEKVLFMMNLDDTLKNETLMFDV